MRVRQSFLEQTYFLVSLGDLVGKKEPGACKEQIHVARDVTRQRGKAWVLEALYVKEFKWYFISNGEPLKISN